MNTNQYLKFSAYILIAIAGCGTQTQFTAHQDKHASSLAIFDGDYPIQVVCTTGPITEALTKLGGEHLKVTGLMGPGIDPHTYKAAPADVDKLKAADLIVYNGLHLEGRMADVFERLGRKTPVWAVTSKLESSADERLRKPPEFEGYYDPHVWHDPKLWEDCIRNVLEQLKQFDATHAGDYQANADEYLKGIASIDSYCREQIARIPETQRVLVTAHDAFGYFSVAFGLETQPLLGISTDDEVAIGRMDEIVDLLVERKIGALFGETAASPRLVEAIVEPCLARGHEVIIPEAKLYADALGPEGSGAETYLNMLQSNVDTIVMALSGNSSLDSRGPSEDSDE